MTSSLMAVGVGYSIVLELRARREYRELGHGLYRVAVKVIVVGLQAFSSPSCLYSRLARLDGASMSFVVTEGRARRLHTVKVVVVL